MNSNSEENNFKYYSNDEGILSIMYHRFDEKKYPSTNIQMDIFKKHIEIIKNSNFNFHNPGNFDKQFNTPKKKKEILITVDDAFKSFYTEAWPYIRENKIPFILFVSTEPVGKKGYMTWQQIKEVEKHKFAFIGHHSHSHEYLIDVGNSEFILDIEKSNKIFLRELGYIPSLFSYPFGEYSKFMKDYISENFKYPFGQHSGVIDLNKDKFELPRFPINEKYGEIKRFKSLLKNIPFPYKKILPEDKYLANNNNPPNVEIHFFDNQINLENINCYSNEQNEWRKSKLLFTKKNQLKIILDGKFTTERGRINCSLRDQSGYWRWLGIQFVIADL